jgi:hypothetical protein
MIGAGVPLDGWTVLIVATTGAVWFLGYWQGHGTGYRRGRRAVARRTLEEQNRGSEQHGRKA